MCAKAPTASWVPPSSAGCAGELINNISLAMVAGLGLRRLAGVIHAYPTQGEAVRQAAQACVQSLAAAVSAKSNEAA